MNLVVSFADDLIFVGAPTPDDHALPYIPIASFIRWTFQEDFNRLVELSGTIIQQEDESETMFLVELEDDFLLHDHLFHIDPVITYEGLDISDDEEAENHYSLINRNPVFHAIVPLDWDDVEGTGGAICEKNIEINAMISANLVEHASDQDLSDVEAFLNDSFPFQKGLKPRTVAWITLYSPDSEIEKVDHAMELSRNHYGIIDCYISCIAATNPDINYHLVFPDHE